jgi:hypothetical protein
VLLLRRAARRGRACPWDGASAPFSTPETFPSRLAEGVPVLLEPHENDVCFAAMVQDPDGNLLLPHRRKDGTAG